MDATEFFKEIILQNGKTRQTATAIRSLTELAAELARFDEAQHVPLVEKLADTHIMLLQLQIMFGISDDELQAMADKKVKKLKNEVNR